MILDRILGKKRSGGDSPQAEPARATDVSGEARAAMARFWSGRGDQGYPEVAEACRKLSKAQLEMLYPWIPSGFPGTTTAIKCDRLRLLVQGIMEEKK